MGKQNLRKGVLVQSDLAGTPEYFSFFQTPPPTPTRALLELFLLPAFRILLVNPSPAPWMPVRARRETRYKVRCCASRQTCLSDSGARLPVGLPPPPPPAVGITLLSNPPSLPSLFSGENELSLSLRGGPPWLTLKIYYLSLSI